MTYTEGRNPREDFSVLAEVSAELEDDMGLVYLGNTYGMPPMDDDEQALICFGRVLNFRPDYIAALYGKAAILASRGYYSESIELIEKALHLKSDFAEALITKSAVLGRLGPDHYQAALEALERAIQLKPEEPLAWYAMATRLMSMERYEEAIVALDQVLHFQPQDSNVWLSRGYCFLKLPGCQQEHTNHKVSTRFLGQVVPAIGSYPAAHLRWEQTLSAQHLVPPFPGVYNLLLWCFSATCCRAALLD